MWGALGATVLALILGSVLAYALVNVSWSGLAGVASRPALSLAPAAAVAPTPAAHSRITAGRLHTHR